MSDPTTTPRATVCPEPGCHVLVPATTEDRREHRAGHLHTAKVDRALREELKAIRALVAEIKGEHATLKRAVDQIEIPEPVEPMRIEDWPEDELAEPADDGLDPDEVIPSSATHSFPGDPVITPQPGAIADHLAAVSDDDFDDDTVEITERRF